MRNVFEVMMDIVQKKAIRDHIINLPAGDLSSTEGDGWTILHFAAAVSMKPKPYLIWVLNKLGSKAKKLMMQPDDICDGESAYRLGIKPKKVMLRADDDNPRSTPLHLAAIHNGADGLIAMLQKLNSVVEKKKAMSLPDDNGISPWHLLLFRRTVGDVSKLQSVLGDEMVVELTLKPDKYNRTGLTAVLCRIGIADKSNVMALFEKVIDIIGEHRAKCLSVMVDKKGDCPLHLAVRYHSSEVCNRMKELLGDEKMNMALRMPRKNGYTSLHLAVQNPDLGVLDIVVEILGDDLEQELAKTTEGGLNPLHIAVRFGKKEMVRKVMDLYGSRVTEIMKTVSGKGNIVYCAASNEVEPEMLDIILPCLDEQTIIEYASFPDSHNQTALTGAIAFKNSEGIIALIKSLGEKAGVVISLASFTSGITPFHVAANSQPEPVIREMILALRDKAYTLATTKNKNKNPKTPRELAKNNPYPNIEQLLSPDGIKSVLDGTTSTSTSTSSNQVSTQVNTAGQITLSLQIKPEDLAKESLIGRGAYGTVYKGTWLRQAVAIKELNIGSLPEKQTTALQTEATIMAKLRSPRIAQLYGVSFTTSYALVMEYLPKGDLFHVLQSSQPFSWQQELRVAIDIGEGLHFLHGQRPPILHRDLKSLNVLLDEHCRAKLTDFGLAEVKRVIRSQSKIDTGGDQQAVGTLAWMAPELFERSPSYSKASDVYAYGVILWELVSREIPFSDAANPGLIPIWVGKGEREKIPEGCDQEYAKLIGQCWSQRSEERPEVTTVIDELSKLTSNQDREKSDAQDDNHHQSEANEYAAGIDTCEVDAGGYAGAEQTL